MNMVDGREKTELYGMYEKGMRGNGTSVMKTFLPDKAFPQRSSNRNESRYSARPFSC